MTARRRAGAVSVAAALIILPLTVGALASCAAVLGLDDYGDRDAAALSPGSSDGAPAVESDGSVGSGDASAAVDGAAGEMDATLQDGALSEAGSGTCAPDATRCAATVPQTCNSTGTAWDNDAVKAGQCGAACTPGENACDGTTTYNQTCQPNGTWGPDVATSGLCGAECTPPVRRCVDPYMEYCSDAGLWPTTPSGTIKPDQCGAVCTPGQKACGNTSSPKPFCTTPGSCWWVWTDETIYDETCDSVGQWGPENLCTGECAGTNGMSYYNCDANNGGCIPQGLVCSQE